MAGIYDHIAGIDFKHKVHVVVLWAALREFKRGVSGVTKESIITEFNLSDQAAQDLRDIADRVFDGRIDEKKVEDVFILAEVRIYGETKFRNELGL